MRSESRQGYAVLETLVAVALLSAATIGLVKIARVHSLIRHRDGARLSAQLVATNLIESLRGKSLTAIQETLEQTKTTLPTMQIRVDRQPVDLETLTGTHIIVSVLEKDPLHATEQPLAREHFWMLEPITEQSDAEASP